MQGNQQNFVYDAFGNRTATVTASGAVGCVGGCDVPDTAVTSQTNPQNHNHLAAATYDDAGNVTSEYGAAYTYDGTGMVRRATVGSDVRDFVYTADDERIAVRQGASWTWSVRDQSGKVLREFTSLETSPSPLTLTSHYWSKDYVWRSGQLLASVFPITPGSTSPTTTYHYHLDHLGTPRLVTDGNHILIGKHAYYPFGAEMNLTPTESATELMKFTGHERDIVAATNGSVDYMHARYYNANLGRFLSVDPVEGDPRQPQSWNRYAYVTNNPVNHTDPTGKCTDILQCWMLLRSLQQVSTVAFEGLIQAAAHSGMGNIMLGAQTGDRQRMMFGQAQLDHEVLTMGMLSYMGAGFEDDVPSSGSTRNMNSGNAEEAIDVGAQFSRYEDVTIGRSVANRAVNVSQADFAKNLESNGFTKAVSKDGMVSMFTKDGMKYTLRDSAKSTGGPTAEVFMDGKLVAKLRLGQ